jgi:hypothetical protein
MTRVRLPPDPELSCVTTIVDSQGGDLALLQAMATRRSMMQHHSSVHGSTDSLAALMERAETSMMTQQSSAPEQTTTPTVKSSGIENVDSIVLVYDLDRVETFFRLENHWLPLIERCYNGKVSRFSHCSFRITVLLRCSSEPYLTHSHNAAAGSNHCGGKQTRSLSPFQYGGDDGRASCSATTTTDCLPPTTIPICPTMHQV